MSKTAFDDSAKLPSFLAKYVHGIVDACWQNMGPQPAQFDNDGNETSPALPAKDVDSMVCFFQPGGPIFERGVVLRVEPRPVPWMLKWLQDALALHGGDGELAIKGELREALNSTYQKLKLPLPSGHLRLLIYIEERRASWVFDLAPPPPGVA